MIRGGAPPEAVGATGPRRQPRPRHRPACDTLNEATLAELSPGSDERQRLPVTKRSHLTPQEAGRRASDPDYLLPGEQRGRTQDAPYWIAIYTELLEFERVLLSGAARALVAMAPYARDEAGTDQVLLSHQADRYRRRLAHWRTRRAGGLGEVTTRAPAVAASAAEGTTAAARRPPVPLP